MSVVDVPKRETHNLLETFTWEEFKLQLDSRFMPHHLVLWDGMELLEFTQCVATPLWPSVGVKPNTCKVGDLESSGTPECSELDSKAQNTSH
jgi:hypothetical protein